MQINHTFDVTPNRHAWYFPGATAFCILAADAATIAALPEARWCFYGSPEADYFLAINTDAPRNWADIVSGGIDDGAVDWLSMSRADVEEFTL